jgi:hypothetical protein
LRSLIKMVLPAIWIYLRVFFLVFIYFHFFHFFIFFAWISQIFLNDYFLIKSKLETGRFYLMVSCDGPTVVFLWQTTLQLIFGIFLWSWIVVITREKFYIQITNWEHSIWFSIDRAKNFWIYTFVQTSTIRMK